MEEGGGSLTTVKIENKSLIFRYLSIIITGIRAFSNFRFCNWHL